MMGDPFQDVITNHRGLMDFILLRPFFLPFMHIIFAICYGSLAVFLLIKDGKAKVYRLCAVVISCFIIWCLGKVISHYPQTPFELAVFSRNIVVVGAWTFSSFLLLFSLALTGRDHYLTKKSLWIVIFAIPVFSICLQWFCNQPLSYVHRSFGWGLSWNNSFWTTLLLCHIFITTFLSGIICLTFSFYCVADKRPIQSKLIAFCILGGMIIGYGTNYLLPFFNFDFPDLAQNIGIIWVSGVVYAVIRYDSLVLNPAIASKEILATLSDALFLTDPKGKILTVNKSGLQRLNIQLKDLLGQNIKSLFAPGQWFISDAEWKMDGRYLVDKDMQMVTKDGNILNVSISVTILNKKNGHPGGQIIIARDIEERIKFKKTLQASHDDLEKRVEDRTAELLKMNNQLFSEIEKRKEASAALQQSEAIFRLISEQSLLGIVILQHNRVVYLNKSWEEITEFTQEEILQWEPNEFINQVHPDDREHMLIQARKKQMGEIDQDISYDWRLLTKSGHEKWISMYSTSIPYKGGTADLATMIDITEQKKLFFSLQESEENYRLLVENANDAIFIIQDRMIKFANEKASDMIGYSKKELLLTPFINFIHPDDKKEIFDRYKKRLNGENIAANQSFSILHKSGDVLWVQTSSVRFKWKGKDAILSFARDLTHERKIETMMNHAQRLSAVGKMAGGIAHDFNNILSPMLGFAEILAEELKHDVENQNRAKHIITASLRGKELTQQILTFSRHKAFVLQEVDIVAVVQETIKLNRAILPKKIRIEEAIEQGCGCVLSDSTQLHQVMMNLVTNAHQAMMANGGTIKISLRQISHYKYAENPEQDYILFRVEDSGVGMDQQTLDKIFDPYFTTKEQGSGLGLPIAMAIIKDLNGYIDVTSKIGFGTCVDLYLPECECKRARQLSCSATEESPLISGKGQIILIDDEHQILDLYGQVLAKAGYQVEKFNTPHLALDAFEKDKTKYDLLITDMSMPGMTGEMVARSVLKKKSDFPVILCTGYSDVISHENASKIGIQALLSKPVSIKKLLATVQKVLEDCSI